MRGTEVAYDDAPLNDRRYEPIHRPVNRRVPEIVAKWGPPSQVRWFHRFWDEIDWRTVDSSRYHIHSTRHLGPCCAGCMSDEEWDGLPVYDDQCCCNASA